MGAPCSPFLTTVTPPPRRKPQFSTTNAYNTFVNSFNAQVNGAGAPQGSNHLLAGPGISNSTGGVNNFPGNSAFPLSRDFYYTGAAASSFTLVVGTASVPEPSSMALCGLLTAGGAWFAAKRRKAAVAA